MIATAIALARNVLPLVDPTPPVPTCAPRIVAPSRAYWLGARMTLSLDGRPAE